MAIGGEEPSHVLLKSFWSRDRYVKKRKTGPQLLKRTWVLSYASAKQQYTIHVVRLNYIRHEAAIQNDSLCPSLGRQADHPSHRFKLHSAKFRLPAESGVDFSERC